MERLGEVYRIGSAEGNYVGSALGSSLGRWGSHISKCQAGTHHNKAVQSAFNEAGLTGFTFSILETGIPEGILRERERYWSNLLSSINRRPADEIKKEKKLMIVGAIIKAIETGETYRVIAKQFGISHGTVGNIKKQYFQHKRAA